MARNYYYGGAGRFREGYDHQGQHGGDDGYGDRLEGRSDQSYHDRMGRYYRGGNRGGGGGGNYRPKKHSGAKWHSTTRNGKPCIAAWNYSRRNGLMSILIAPYKNTAVHKSQNGREWENWMCKVSVLGRPTQHFPVLVDVNQQKATIEDFGWVVNCRAPNGGYCGTFTKR